MVQGGGRQGKGREGKGDFWCVQRRVENQNDGRRVRSTGYKGGWDALVGLLCDIWTRKVPEGFNITIQDHFYQHRSAVSYRYLTQYYTYM